MTKDFSQYSKIINHFRGQVSQSDFEVNFAKATTQLPKTERFLLKMELKRLAGRCTRLIDLRGHVDGECKPFEHDGRTHFLDDVAIKSYQQNFSAYGGYTFGVYEAVNNTENNFRVIYQKEKNNLAVMPSAPEVPKVLEKQQYPAKHFQFGYYFNRNEERMNFAMPIMVTLASGREQEATSLDLSVSGCKFKFSERQKITQGDKIQLVFTGLLEEFQFGDNYKFDYQVCNIQYEGNLQLVGTKRVIDGEKDGFKQFLTGFIQGNKRRYKINLDNTIAALQARSLEQFALPKSNELPIFIESINGKTLPKYALTSNNNQSTYQYWQDEAKRSTLHYLITPERLARLQSATRLGKSLTVYSFIHQNHGLSYFYTADDKQLSADKNFMKQFIGFAAAKSTFSVIELSLLNVDSDKAYTPYTVARSLSKKDEYLNLPPSDEVLSCIKNLSHIVVALDITDEQVHADYASLDSRAIDTSRLKVFGHKRLKKAVPVDEIGINYRNQRQEQRFKYETPITINAEDLVWTGHSQDFSVSGLKVHLDTPAMLKKGDIVALSLPKLQKVTASFELKSLPYEVVQINKKKNIVNLRVHVEKHHHTGRSFFKVLIEKNRDKLTPDEYALMIPGLAKALRSIYAQTLELLTLYVQTSGSRYKIETIGSSYSNSRLLHEMKALSDRPSYYNLYPLLNNQKSTLLMSSTLKKLQVADAPVTETLYIAIKQNSELIDQAVTTKLESQLNSAKLKQMFITSALKQGQFYCIKLILSRAEAPDMEHLNPELSYIGSYAIHRGKQIEQDIWSVAGVIQCFDITQEVKLRYQLLS